jgi:hypothetical protein
MTPCVNTVIDGEGGRENACYVLEFPVVCASTGGVDEAPCDARDEELIRDDEFYDRVERLSARCEHRVELLGLWDCTRETVEYEAMCAKAREKTKVSAGTRWRGCCKERTRSCTSCCSRVGPESCRP